MATRQELEAAILKADAAGDAEAVQALGQEYRRISPSSAPIEVDVVGGQPSRDGQVGPNGGLVLDVTDDGTGYAEDPTTSAAAGLPKPPPRSMLQTIGDTAGHVVDGLTGSWGDEIYATGAVAGNGINALLGRDTFRPGEVFDAGQAEYAQNQQQSYEEHPYLTLGAKAAGMAGGLLLPGVNVAKGVGMGARIANGAATGATYGAFMGAGEGDGIERLGNSVAGAAAGSVIGGAAPPVIEGAGEVINRLARVAAPYISEGATKRVVQAAADRLTAKSLAPGFTPTQAAAEVADRQGQGVPAMVGDLTDQAQQATGYVSRGVGPGQEAVRKAIASRQANMAPRVRQHIEDTLGPTVDPYRQSAELSAKASRDAGPLYKDAFQGGSMAPLERQFEDAFGRSSAELSQARRELAQANQAETLAAGQRVREGGNVYGDSAALRAQRGATSQSRDASQRVADIEAEHTANLDRLRRAQEDGSAGAPGAVWSPRIQSFLNDPIMQDGIGRGVEVQRLEALANGTRFDPTELAVVGTHPTTGAPIVASVPNMRTLDTAKRGLDEILNGYRNPMTGALELDQRGRAVNEVRKSLLSELDTLNPTYGQARAAAAGPLADKTAFRTGQQSIPGTSRSTIGDAQAQMQGMSGSELEQFRLGDRTRVADAVDGDINAVGRFGDATAPLTRNDARMRLLSEIHGPEAADKLFSRAGAESDAHKVYKEVWGGSPTANRQAFSEDMADEATGRAARNAFSGNLASAAKDILVGVWTGRLGKYGSLVRDEMGQMLTQGNVKSVEEAMARIEHRLATDAAFKKRVARATAEIGKLGAVQIVGNSGDETGMYGPTDQ